MIDQVEVIDKIVTVAPSCLPALTLSGVIWCPGFTNKHRSCDDCPMLNLCGESVNSGNYAGCEVALESEIWKDPIAIDEGG